MNGDAEQGRREDRTGCTAALLLTLAGVGREDILADYQVTELAAWPFPSQLFFPL